MLGSREIGCLFISPRSTFPLLPIHSAPPSHFLYGLPSADRAEREEVIVPQKRSPAPDRSRPQRAARCSSGWLVAIELVFETHSTTVDNEQGALPAGRRASCHNGDGRRPVSWGGGEAATRSPWCSAPTWPARPRPHRWPSPIPRSRCATAGGRANAASGSANGRPVADLRAGQREHLDRTYPGGESWRQGVTRVGRFLANLPLRWNGQRVLVIGHVATRWGLDHYLGGFPLEELMEQDFAWPDGWDYQAR